VKGKPDSGVESTAKKLDDEFQAFSEQLLERTEQALQAKEEERLQKYKRLENELLAQDR
jgi:hypothetical protein